MSCGLTLCDGLKQLWSTRFQSARRDAPIARQPLAPEQLPKTSD